MSRNLVTVDLTNEERILEASIKASGKKQSEVLREALTFYHLFRLWEVKDKVVKAATSKPRRRPGPPKLGPLTDADKKVISVYRETFDYSGRVHNPAVMRAIRAAEKSGVDIETILGLIRVAKKDTILSGRTPALHELLSEKMIGRLMALEQDDHKHEEVDEAVRLRDVVKVRAVREAKTVLPQEKWSGAYDLIMRARSESQVQAILERLKGE